MIIQTRIAALPSSFDDATVVPSWNRVRKSMFDRDLRVRGGLRLRLMTSSSTRNSVSTRISVARSSQRRRSASPCSPCRMSYRYFVRVSMGCITPREGFSFLRILSIPADPLASASRAEAMSASICSIQTRLVTDAAQRQLRVYEPRASVAV